MLMKSKKIISFMLVMMLILSSFTFTASASSVYIEKNYLNTAKKPYNMTIKYVHSDDKGQLVAVSESNDNYTVKKGFYVYPYTTVAGYQLAYSKDETFKNGTKYITETLVSDSGGNRNTAVGPTVSILVKNLKPGDKYYCKMRSYIKKDGKKVYSDWSNVMSGKVSSKRNKEADDYTSKYDNFTVYYCSTCCLPLGTGYNGTCDLRLGTGCTITATKNPKM